MKIQTSINQLLIVVDMCATARKHGLEKADLMVIDQTVKYVISELKRLLDQQQEEKIRTL